MAVERDRLRLITIELFVGLMAVPSGVLLTVNGLGMSRDVLDDSPFGSFLVPGLVLAFVVGSSLLGAAYLELRRLPIAALASLGAGCVLLGWIAIEAVMVKSGRELQVAIFGCAALTLLLAGRQWRRGRASTASRNNLPHEPFDPLR